MRSNAAEQVIDGKLTRLLADGTWVPMGDGSLSRNDWSAARRLDGGAGKGLVLLNKVNATDVSLRAGVSRGSLRNPNNSFKLKQLDRALTLKRSVTDENPKCQNNRRDPKAVPL